jgi:hypothetical protein
MAGVEASGSNLHDSGEGEKSRQARGTRTDACVTLPGVYNHRPS